MTMMTALSRKPINRVVVFLPMKAAGKLLSLIPMRRLGIGPHVKQVVGGTLARWPSTPLPSRNPC